jgi:hypothetical protein
MAKRSEVSSLWRIITLLDRFDGDGDGDGDSDKTLCDPPGWNAKQGKTVGYT